MFSYTDEAIVTSSPTGRHLSTVIRALPGVPTDLWRQHAEAVCKVLNELKDADRLIDAGKIASEYTPHDRSLYVQQCGREPQGEASPVEMTALAQSGFDPVDGHYLELKGTRGTVLRRVFGTREAALMSEAYSAFQQCPLPISVAQRLLFSDTLIESLERELADAHEKLREPIRMSRDALTLLSKLDPNQTMTYNNHIFKRVE